MNLRPVHMGSQVPSPNSWLSSPNMKAKSQLLSLHKPNNVRFIFNEDGSRLVCAQQIVGFVSRVGFSFLFDKLSTQVTRFTFKKCCHVGIHVILGTYDPCGKSQLSMLSMAERLHGLSSSDLGLKTKDPM